MKQLYTRWGKDLDPQNVLQEYPRPLLKRSSYINLNGYWDYAFTKEFKKPQEYDGTRISGTGAHLHLKDGTQERTADRLDGGSAGELYHEYRG